MADVFAHERPMLLERLGRLMGSTTYRDQDSGGGSPFSARRLTSEAEMLIALKLSQRNPRDIGPWMVYSYALRVDDRRREIVMWLAGKLELGTGAAGVRNSNRMLSIALAAYNLAVHSRPVPLAPKQPREFELLASVGAGWLMTAMESAIDRAESAKNG